MLRLVPELRWKQPAEPRQPDEFEVDGIEFVCRPAFRRFRSTATRFCLLKAPWAVEAVRALVEELAPRTILELGIYDGGSMALFSQLARPDKLVAIDLRTEPSEGLAAFLAARGLERTVVPYYGVDQADVTRLHEIVAGEFAGAELDLVIDDASHLVPQSRASFNCLFPRLRAGGVYLLEDWSWAHARIPFQLDETPLTVLLFELLLACARAPGMVAEVRVQRGWALIVRGSDEVDVDTFDVSELTDERGRDLVPDLRNRPLTA